ncbi:MAG: CapA family protein [Chloroflexota bacterium]|nr:CapA family protein [Chloroflexota bacterium]
MTNGRDRPIIVAALGDFIFFDRPDPADIAATRPLLAGADIVIGNIDVVLSDRGTPVPKWANLRASPQIAHDLRELGLDVAVVANNHTMDYRAEAMADCLAAYEAAGIRPSGAGANLAEATAPTIIATPHGTVAILSVCSTLSPESAAGAESPGVAPLNVRQSYLLDESLLVEQPGTPPEVHTWPDERDLARARRDITAARRQADHVLVVIHWGVPSPWRMPASPIIQPGQRTIGHALIEAGADVVIGNHAHELHGIEFHQGKPIIYCLGNFWIDGISRFPWMGREAIVLRLLLRPGADVRLELVSLYLDNRGVPRPDTTARAVRVLTEQSREFGVILAADAGRYRVLPALTQDVTD